jgi:hypothetical protein
VKQKRPAWMTQARGIEHMPLLDLMRELLVLRRATLS